MRVPLTERTQAFFNCWTRKEAFIKALGMGLSLPLDQFDVSLAPGETAALLRTRWDANEALKWSLTALDIASEYAAAVVVEGVSAFHVEHLDESSLFAFKQKR
jgi:4'-phosphopantetheinyl transferase